MTFRGAPSQGVHAKSRAPQQVFAALLLSLTALVLSACESKLPGPIECEQMAVDLLGRAAQELSESPLEQRWVANMVHGCLTTPFDYEALECLTATRNLPGCMNEMLTRAPERRSAVRALLAQNIGFR